MVDFTLQLRNAMINRNDRKFFKLYESSPHMSAYLIDYLLNPMRIRIYDAMMKSYDSVSLQFIMEKLNFVDVKECKEFIDIRNVKYVSQSTAPAKNIPQDATSSSLKSKRKEKKVKKQVVQVAEVVSIDPSAIRIDCRASRSGC